MIKEVTDFGFRTVQWNSKLRFLNGKPVFINGVTELEHLIGHFFILISPGANNIRVKWLQAAGVQLIQRYQPHNLLYGKLFNENYSLVDLTIQPMFGLIHPNLKTTSSSF